MTHVFGPSKRKIGTAMNCDKGEIGGAGLGRKMMNMILYISSLGCLLDVPMEIWSS